MILITLRLAAVRDGRWSLSIDIAQEIPPHFTTKNLFHSRQRCEAEAMRSHLEDAAVMLHANTRPFQRENPILLLGKMDHDFS
jgi:hypothetical protein